MVCSLNVNIVWFDDKLQVKSMLKSQGIGFHQTIGD